MGKRSRYLSLLATMGLILATVAAPAIAGQTTQRAQKTQSRHRVHSPRDQIVDTPTEVHEAQDQHGPTEGHLPPSSLNVELVGQADIEGVAPERVADVSAYGNYAYLTVRDPEECSDAGVAIMDISDPSNPEQVGFIDATEGSFPGEGSQVVDLKTASFTGQVLIFNNEICAEGGIGGASLWDVTDPSNPRVLKRHVGDDDPGGFLSRFNEIHSSFGWQAGKRAFMVIVDNEETTDVDIFEITDPRNPEFISELDLNEEGVLQDNATPLDAAAFLHDMVVKKVKGTWTMLLSYWDGGWVLLDVDNPAKPKFIDDFDYPTRDILTGLSPSEGNAHQAEFSPNGRFIIGTDEDFSPYRIEELAITSGANIGSFEASAVGGGAAPALLPDEELNGPTVYGGYGCPPDLYPGATPVPQRSDYDLNLAPGEEAILVLQRGPEDDPSEPLEEACFPGEKAAEAIEAGWDAVVLVNRHFGEAEFDLAFCGSGVFPEEPPIVTACTTHEAFHKLFNSEPAYDLPYDNSKEPELGAEGERVSATGVFDGWGYVRLLRTSNLKEIDAYAIDEALDPAFAFGFGALSVHEVATDPYEPGLAYLAYYSGGIRVIQYGPHGLEEVGHYVDQEGSNFWGIEVHRLPGSDETLILGSDRDSGLWIFRYTGDDPS